MKCIFFGVCLLAAISVRVKCSNVPVYSSYSVTNDVLDDNEVVSDSVYNKGSNFYNYYENVKEDKVQKDANVDILSNAGSCTSDRLVVYKAVLHTYWTRELFPKHYPDWRPTAQWTKTIGRTHDNTFALYHLGQRASDGVKQFAETGKSDILENLSSKPRKQLSSASASTSSAKMKPASSPQNDLDKSSFTSSNGDDSSKWNKKNPIFDDFTLPPITTGSGRSESKFFVDGNHSHVSLMTKILPSPDWFIGVDSFQLCAGGTWLDTVTVEMDPLDAGTDNGFTFTAPNWPTVPQGVIYRITSRYPAHPAGSFFYPKSKRLPPIATFQFIKLKEYELSEVFNISEDDRKYETVKTQTRLESEHNHVEMNNELSASIEKERQNEVTEGPALTSEKDRIRARLLEKINGLANQTELHQMTSTNNKNFVRKNDKSAILQNIANNYKYNKKYHRKKISPMSSSASTSTMLQQEQNQQQQQQQRLRPHRRDCRVSHWSEWSECNKTCGIGEMHRYRRIIKHPKRGGRSCPPLKESKWCGTGKGCPMDNIDIGSSKEEEQQPENYINW